MNESTRSQAVKNRFRDPELTIAVGFLAIGAAIYAVETYLSPSLLLDGGDPVALAAVFGVIGLFYLTVLLVARATNAV
jgi:hypothetical protein